jgi:predicted O-methyltransferase YrrM
MFTMTKPWLRKHYGSANPSQAKQSRDWLQKYGKNVPDAALEEWSKWKHLIEYQVNTEDIVAQALSRVDTEFKSELDAHRFLNLMRVPQAVNYEKALEIVKPITVLELGVGGDSAISTALFLAYLEGCQDGHLTSIERNPLGTTWIRYGRVSHWKFIQTDSVKFLTEQQSSRFDMIFIDTIHSYTHTMKELELSSKITNAILCDDIQFEGNQDDPEPGGVKRAWEEWMEHNPKWEPIVLHNNIGLLKKRTLVKRRRYYE